MLFKRALALLLVALALPYACAPVYRFPAPRAFQGAHLYNPYARLHGTWQLANLHAHGRAWKGLTNGRQTDAEVVKAYRARGYDVAGISDYFEIASHNGVPSIALYEHGINIGKHHQLAIGARRVDWFDLPIWQGTSQKQYVINRVRRSAELVALAHPSIMPVGYTADDLRKLSGYDLLEIQNGRFGAEELWDVALSSGHAVWAIGNDDTHDVTDPDRMAVAWNMIDAPSQASSDVIAALRDGRSYTVAKTAGDPPDGSDATLSGIAISGGTMTVTVSRPATISFVGQNGRELRTVRGATSAAYTLAPADTYVRTVVRTPHTTMYLNPVLRSEDRTLPLQDVTIDAPKTWAARAALVLACAALLIGVFTGRSRRAGSARDANGRRLRRASAMFFIFLAAAGIATPASAQTAPERTSIGEGPALGGTFTFDLLRDLPTSDNLFSVPETMQAETISDRFTGAGLNFGASARIGAFGSSWTQTLYRIGDANVTDGAGNGAPLFFPEVDWWERVGIASGVMPADLSAPGAAITLEPRRPSATWQREASASTSFGDALTRTTGGGLAVPISTPAKWNRASVVASGPLAPDRAGIFFAGSWTGTSQRDRSNPNAFDASVGSAFAHLLFTPNDRDEIRTVGLVQRVSRPEPNRALFASLTPSRDDASVHVQSTWQRRESDDGGWTAFASFTHRASDAAGATLTSATVDRLVVGPIPELVAVGNRRDSRWSAGARYVFAPRGFSTGNHIARVGADVTGASTAIAPTFIRTIHELTDGIPSRLWLYRDVSGDDRRHATTFAAFASDRIESPSGLLVDAALRYEWIGGAADGAATNVRWNAILPRVSVQQPLWGRFDVRAFAAYARSAYQLPLDALAWGDPAAPSAVIVRASAVPGGQPAPGAPLVGAWGPGPGGAVAFSGIDANLKRPYSDDISFGIDAHPSRALRFQLAAVGKWEKRLLGVVNRSAVAPSYSIVGIRDPGLDLEHTQDDQVLPVSNLVLPAPLGYQFRLTNPADATARLLALRFVAEAQTGKLFLLLGATAGKAEGIAAYQGFGPTENDQGMIGDVFVDPNAAIHPRGRLFNDRAYTGRISVIYRFPWGIRAGAIARYQDGQPFARLVIASDLNQGAEAIRAFPNGGSRFTYTGTLDLRLQKEFAAGSHRLAIVLDGYNIVNLGNEVEERVMTGTTFRTPTAIQPPLTVHVGARILF